ncbi:uncharacterized protein LOC126470356 isoform X1 [Schistocerca serialis cubense]|uniref:uncharacterized protein LOC126470356 isoform X1 n=1 Tax=Schistocerca serialis cubense TaxID=2023355 RepID=UPI00214EC1B1|nr:uncharacterized protein LOC126470356 isoform X1 [Schistocerca serialis cubense]
MFYVIIFMLIFLVLFCIDLANLTYISGHTSQAISHTFLVIYFSSLPHWLLHKLLPLPLSASFLAGYTSHCHVVLLTQLSRLLVLHASLVAKDTEIFEQLFALQEAVLDLKDQVDYSSSSESASPYQSPSSTRSNSSSEADRNVRTKRSASFVRQHVSYPPIKRNRSNRMKATTPQHGCQDSYDSGIHTSDHEIFV